MKATQQNWVGFPKNDKHHVRDVLVRALTQISQKNIGISKVCQPLVDTFGARKKVPST